MRTGPAGLTTIWEEAGRCLYLNMNAWIAGAGSNNWSSMTRVQLSAAIAAVRR